MTTEAQRRQMGRFIIDDEARRDNRGHLMVYPLPSGDGGGRYEVAGINDRYHPVEYAELATMLRNRQWDAAEKYASDYMVRYTDVVRGWQPDMSPGVEYELRDTAFNRGPTGAARILQMALGVNVDGIVGPVTKMKLATMPPDEMLQRLRAAREKYERIYAHRDERSKFWKGLVNRWNKVAKRAGELNG